MMLRVTERALIGIILNLEVIDTASEWEIANLTGTSKNLGTTESGLHWMENYLHFGCQSFHMKLGFR